MPDKKVVEIPADGGYQYDLPKDWQEGISRIVKVEFPAGEETFEPGDYTIYKSPSGMKLHFFVLTPQAPFNIRITYA